MKSYYLPERRNEMQRIFGGIYTANPVPWQAIIYRYDNFACSAIIIDQTTLLSAAHCFAVKTSTGWVDVNTRPEAHKISVGSKKKNDPKNFERIKPADIILHPDYDHTKDVREGNDIAVIKLPWEQRLTWNIDIERICLPTKSFQDVMEDCDFQTPRPRMCKYHMSLECYISGFGRGEKCKSFQPLI